MNTLIIGASEKPERYAYNAAAELLANGHEVSLYANKSGHLFGIDFIQKFPTSGIDTVTLYIGPKHQPEIYDDLVRLKPRRVLFNPGTENPELKELLEENNIIAEEVCTLVLLSIGQYDK